MPAAADRADRQIARDRATLIRFVKAYRSEFAATLSIDTLLTRTYDAFKMGLYVAHRQQRIDRRTAETIGRVLDALVKKHGAAMDAIDGVLHDALNARKRGEFALKKRD